MIVYIESNFILEIVLQQKEALAAEDILKLAESNKIELVFPSFALSEPFSTIMHIQSERRRWMNFSQSSILNQLEAKK